MFAEPVDIVQFVPFTLTRCPAIPSKSTSATLPAVVIVTVLLSPIDIRPVYSMLAAVYGLGGTMKSAELITLP